MNDRRKVPRIWTRFIPKFVLRRQVNDCLVSYRRESAKNGQLPSLATYFDFLYLKQKGADLAGPNAFQSIRGFYDQMQSAIANNSMALELEAAKKKCVLVSLAPSACQAEADWNGFHIIEIGRDANRKLTFQWDRYEYKDAGFLKKRSDEHVS